MSAPNITVNVHAVSIEGETARGRGYETVVAAVTTEHLLRRLVRHNDVRQMMLQALLDFDREREPYHPPLPVKRRQRCG